MQGRVSPLTAASSGPIPKAPRSAGGYLLGRSDGSLRTMQILGRPGGPIQVSVPFADWIKPTGGAYLFAPSRSGLVKFATAPAAIGLWKSALETGLIGDEPCLRMGTAGAC
jgi:hypothetical protein